MLVVINKDSLMQGSMCSTLHGGWSHMFTQQQSSINSQIFVEILNFCLPHLHLMPPLGGSPLEFRHDVLVLTHSLTAALDQLRFVASSTSNDPGPRSRQHQQILDKILKLFIHDAPFYHQSLQSYHISKTP